MRGTGGAPSGSAPSPDRVWRAMTEVCRGMVLGTHQRISSLGTDRYLAWPTLILSFAADCIERTCNDRST